MNWNEQRRVGRRALRACRVVCKSVADCEGKVLEATEDSLKVLRSVVLGEFAIRLVYFFSDIWKMSENLEAYNKVSESFSVLIASAFEKDRESVLLMAEDMEVIDEKYARVFRWVISNYAAFSDIEADEGFNE